MILTGTYSAEKRLYRGWNSTGFGKSSNLSPDCDEDHHLVDGWQVGQQVDEDWRYSKDGVGVHQANAWDPGNSVFDPCH